MVAGILKDKMGLEPNPDFVGTRKGILDPDTLTKEERAKLIQENRLTATSSAGVRW